jgi:Na+/H+-dicarboxylate symporter
VTSSTQNILIGLGLGTLLGLFLGERAALLQFMSDGYLRLLQMTVFPYVIVSLITGIGSLDAKRARDLFVRVGALTLVLWGLALVAVFLMPLTFPAIQNAFFFSTTLVEERAPLDFVALYIPANPFQSLANSIVPAVVLFSAFLGVALMGIEKKEPLLGALQVLERVLGRANRFSLRLTPLGLFAIAAVTVGTADAEQLGRLRVFLIGYAAMSLLLTLWILPGFVACLTPIPARRILQSTRDALITAFITGELFIVLPVLIDRSKALLQEHGNPQTEEGAPAEVIVPAFYSFPHVAKLLSLSFVLFAAWYSDTELALPARAQLALAGIVSLFGSMNAAIPFLLDLVRVPSGTFQLFLATGVLNSRFGTLAAAMHMVVLALAGTYALTGQLRFSSARIALPAPQCRSDRGNARGRRSRVPGDRRRDLRPGSGGPGHAIPQSAVAEGRRAARAAVGAPGARRRRQGRAAGGSGARGAARGLHRWQHALQLLERAGRAGGFRRGDGPRAGRGAGGRAGVRARPTRPTVCGAGGRSVRRDHGRSVLDDAARHADGLLGDLPRRDAGIRRPRPSPRGLLERGVDPRHHGSQGGGPGFALPDGPRAS